MTPPLALVSILCLAFSRYHWAAWPMWGALVVLMTGRDPLYLIEHSARWLRASLIRWACLLSWWVLREFAGAKKIVVEEEI